MRAFAALLDRLMLTPQRNVKLRLMTDYFRATPDPDRGYALAALTGELDIPSVKPAMLRALVTARVDEALFAWSYDYVGDLAETIALIWPEDEAGEAAGSFPSPERAGSVRRSGEGSGTSTPTRLASPTDRPPRKGGGEDAPPGASPVDIVERLQAASRMEGPRLVEELARPARCLRPLGADQACRRRPQDRRVGAAGQAGSRRRRRRPVNEIEEVWHGLKPPYETVCVAGRARTGAAIDRQGAIPPGDAGARHRRRRAAR